ncbi:MAG: hypothetical protein J4452_03930 [Candidatus Aenigmarchaeota archaeon]|nr:hypothetical protein [Candidatus Aenigmarchaeota archaeon]
MKDGIEINDIVVVRFSQFFHNKKALSSVFIYSFVLIFFTIYVLYFSRFVQYSFAATPIFTQNQSTPTSPNTFSNWANISFSVNITANGAGAAGPIDANGVIFQIGRNISFTYQNITKCATPAEIACTWNTSPTVWIINFTPQTFDQAGVSNFTWFSNDSNNFGNKTQTVRYTLNKANPSSAMVIQSNVTSPIAYITASDVGGTESNTSDNDLTYTLYRGNSTFSDGTSPWNDTARLGGGTYAYNFSTTGGTNYTAGSASNFTLVVDKKSPTLTFTLDSSASSPQQKTYSGFSQTSSLATTCGFPGNEGTYPTCTLYRSDVSLGTGNASATTAEGNSTIFYNYTSAAAANWTASSLNRTLLVLKGGPRLNLSINVSSPITYPSGANAKGGNCTMIGATDASCTLYVGNTSITNSSTPSVTLAWTSYNILPGAGTIAFNFSVATSANWTAASASNVTLVTDKGSQGVSVSFSPSATVTYPTSTTTSCSRTSGDSSSTITLFRNGTNVASGTSSPQSEIITLGVGTYNYSCVISSTANYSEATTVNNILTVSSDTPILTVTFDPSAFEAYGTSTTAQGNGCVSELTCKLHRNDTVVATSPTTSETITLGVGNYSYVYNTSGNANYSSATSASTILSLALE